MTERPHRLAGARAMAPAIGLFLVAVNLRSALVAVSPLLDEIRLDTGMSETMAGLLTTLPVLCFGLFSPVVPRLARRFGIEGAVVLAMAVLVFGSAIRTLTPLAALFAGTAVIGIGICVGNVVLPALVKRDHDHRIGLMTGVYTTSLSVSAALAAALTVPLQHLLGLSWRAALALWAIPAVVAGLVWLRPWRHHRQGLLDPVPIRAVRGLYRNRLAWALTLFMGMQSTVYYSTTAWLPTLFTDGGFSPDQAGALLGLANLVSLPTSLLTPILAGRMREQRSLNLAVSLAVGAAMLGLIFAPMGAPTVWMVLLGIGQGGSVGLAFSLIGLRSPDGSHVSQISSMSQTVGYGMAAAGPLLMGAVVELTGSWPIAFALPLLALLMQHLAGMAAGRDLRVAAVPDPGQPIISSSVGNDGEINS